MRLIDYGSHAVLAEYDGLDDVLQVADQLRRARHGGAEAMRAVEDVVVASRTILVRFDERPAGLDTLLQPDVVGRNGATARTAPDRHAAGSPAVELTVDYDGADLAAVADRLGATPGELIAIHTAPTYTVAFCGFAPGFAYLVGSDPRLHLPRLATPRTRVPPGSVAIAGPFTGVYPTASPGGWHLLGTTSAALFDAVRTPPALLAPGTRVRFVAT